MTKILNIGSLNIDYVYSVDHFIQPGETMSSLGRNIFHGGKGLNQSIALAKAGAQVYHCGLVGKDDGLALRDTLQQAGVNVDYVKAIDGPSGHTIIQVNPTGQNCIILFGGSNQCFSIEMIDSVLSNFESGDFVVLQNEVNALEHMINQAHAKGLKIFFNVSPCDAKVLSLPLDKCYCLIINEIEAATLSNVDESKQDDPYAMLEALSQKYPSCNVVLTMGTRGAYFMQAGYPNKDQILYQESFKVKAVDTTAAGDTFLGFLVGMLSQGQEGQEAMAMASKAAAISVTRHGAGASIPSIAEVENFDLATVS